MQNTAEQVTKNAINTVTRQVNPDTLTIFSTEELGILGIVPLPKGFSVQEEYKGVKLIQTPHASFTPEQLSLVRRFIDATPQKLLTPGPSAITTYSNEEIGIEIRGISSVAFASGNYIFFNTNSFNGGVLGGLVSDDSIDQAFATFEHELMHVSQFNAAINDIAAQDFRKLAAEKRQWTHIVEESQLFSDFAKQASWEKSATDEKSIWKLGNTATLTTEYGKTAIFEDMAETISGIIMTKEYEFSAERQAWAYAYLGESKDTLKRGKLPFSKDLLPVKSFLRMIDYTKKELYTKTYKLTDQQTFINETPNSLEIIKAYYETELPNRGWQGAFTKEVKSDGVEIYKGDFKGSNRDMYLELRSYDNATGYSQKPTGTEVNVISGYNI